MGNANGYRTYFSNQFRTLDRDKNGYLTRTQLAPAQYVYLRGILDIADRNGDDKLQEQELHAYLDLVSGGVGTQVTVSLVETGRGLFQALDANGDGQLSIRELRNAWARLSACDSDGDGLISRAEIPQQYRLALSQGGAAAVPRPPVPVVGGGMVGPGVARPAPTRGPLWFRKMDRNGDGDVSRREWLGTEEDFKRIDTDGDGLISVEEAERADAWFRARLERKP
jgi:Ca2+-binding EF-hand superfamily protein